MHSPDVAMPSKSGSGRLSGKAYTESSADDGDVLQVFVHVASAASSYILECTEIPF